MAISTLSSPEFLDKVVDFPDGASYELVHPITDYRACHDGTPLEARILYTCKWLGSTGDQEYVMKVKVQIPGNSKTDIPKPEEGPSTTTALELKALETFRGANSAYAPQLLGFKRAVQSDSCPLPGGYLTYTLMNKIPGDTLFNLHFWGLPEDERRDIVQKFLKILRTIYELGIQPEDRGLRNIMWDRETKTCNIIDFEMWKETKQTITDETKELQRWGLARSPPQKWWETWFSEGH
ncbi:hypothetical protein NA57DRAFT_78457 [Rhizodiscina lignyota]|uniref:Protein kinase domain-containing protein n=1 Tax=Rhizodiscina lignyota TaxID=1504668 RepID=A0A9P4M4G6_9PEZI|nr:hypothetical protein NA57DRAFT_78457 [Rhizodiscina lignyota]